MMTAHIELLADSNRGVFIPQYFEESASRGWFRSVSDWALDALREGPDGADYWEAWAHVLDNAEFTTEAGRRYTLHQDGDLWAIADDAPPSVTADFLEN
jgi:hypothetical protein